MRRIITFIILSLLLFTPFVFAEDIGLKNISSVKIDSILVDNTLGFNHLRFTIKAKKAGNFEPIIDVKKAMQKSLEYFFIGLVMDEDKFWVNLNPHQPDKVIDSILGSTDLGRIMLKSDLRLKEDMCELTNPQTSELGREFWSRLYEKAGQLGATDKIPVITRLWIVPDEVVVYETENEFSIVKSRLRVCLESAYLSQNIEIRDKKQKELQDYASNLMEELILSHLNKKVNESYAYADLREVYQALILSRWYKQKASYQYNGLLRTVDLNIIKDTGLEYFSTPGQIYSDYLKSLKNGEYSFMERENGINSFYSMITIKHYFSGGVDLRNIKLTKVDSLPQEETDKASHYLTCDLYIPQGVERPLEYAKNQFELTPGKLTIDQDAPLRLASNLPAIAPLRFIEQRIQSIESTNKAEILVLSKL